MLMVNQIDGVAWNFGWRSTGLAAATQTLLGRSNTLFRFPKLGPDGERESLDTGPGVEARGRTTFLFFFNDAGQVKSKRTLTAHAHTHTRFWVHTCTNTYKQTCARTYNHCSFAPGRAITHHKITGATLLSDDRLDSPGSQLS